VLTDRRISGNCTIYFLCFGPHSPFPIWQSTSSPPAFVRLIVGIAIAVWGKTSIVQASAQMFGAPMLSGLTRAGVYMVALLVLVAWKPGFIAPLFRKPAAPFEVTPLDITKGAMPFIWLRALALALVYIFPGLALWLPAAIGW
jgi:TRAP-type mannitol/chloroaromatic compound transport system permease large subunit